MHKHTATFIMAIVMLRFLSLSLPVAACSVITVSPTTPLPSNVLPPVPAPTRTSAQQAIADETDVQSAIASADVVFRGQVRNIQEQHIPGMFLYTFAVNTLWKGSSGGEISVTNIGEFSDCRQSVDVPFAIGKSYIVYAARSATGLAPMAGSREAEVTPREDAILGPGLPLSAPTATTPHIASGTTTQKPSPKPALFLLLLVGAVIVACLMVIGAVSRKR